MTDYVQISVKCEELGINTRGEIKDLKRSNLSPYVVQRYSPEHKTWVWFLHAEKEAEWLSSPRLYEKGMYARIRAKRAAKLKAETNTKILDRLETVDQDTGALKAKSVTEWSTTGIKVYVMPDGPFRLGSREVIKALISSVDGKNANPPGFEIVWQRNANVFNSVSVDRKSVTVAHETGATTAQTITEDEFTDLLDAVLQADHDGTLEDKQEHMLENVRRIVEIFYKTGLHYCLQRVTGATDAQVVAATDAKFAKLLLREPKYWDYTFSAEFARAICGMLGRAFDERHPESNHDGLTYQWIYRTFLTDEVYEDLKASVNGRTRLHQMLSDEVRLPGLLNAIETIAEHHIKDKEGFYLECRRKAVKYRRLAGLSEVSVPNLAPMHA